MMSKMVTMICGRTCEKMRAGDMPMVTYRHDHTDYDHDDACNSGNDGVDSATDSREYCALIADLYSA